MQRTSVSQCSTEAVFLCICKTTSLYSSCDEREFFFGGLPAVYFQTCTSLRLKIRASLGQKIQWLSTAGRRWKISSCILLSAL
eukprot:10975177-Karenia_brevis.AAC.1